MSSILKCISTGDVRIHTGKWGKKILLYFLYSFITYIVSKPSSQNDSSQFQRNEIPCGAGTLLLPGNFIASGNKI